MSFEIYLVFPVEKQEATTFPAGRAGVLCRTHTHTHDYYLLRLGLSRLIFAFQDPFHLCFIGIVGVPFPRASCFVPGGPYHLSLGRPL